jgi:hypothetical protein
VVGGENVASRVEPARHDRCSLCRPLGVAAVVPSLATASLDAAERRALQRLVGLLRRRFAEELDAVWLYGPRVRGEAPQDESELQLLALLRHSSRGDRVTALELLWQAALAERATESYFSIRISDRASPERRRTIDEFLAREVEPDGIALFARSGAAPGGTRKTNSGEAAAEY